MQHRSTRVERAARRRLLGAGVALVVWAWLGAGPAGAREIQIGEFSGSLDTTLTVGTSIRVQDRECDIIYLGHGGCNTDAFYINADDGNLNYDKWDFYSAAVKATVELELSRENLGAFFRATAFYDAVANEHDPQRTDLDRDARYRSSPINSGVLGLGFLLLDAYAYGSFDVAGRSVHARLGNQVLSWGESLFTPGGIAQTNAIDVTRLRVPGSQLKEAFLPAPMLWVSVEPFENLGIEGYYQAYWNRTQVDPTGSYFSTSDLVGRAAEGLFFPARRLEGTGLFGSRPVEDTSLPADPGGTGLAPEERLQGQILTPVPQIPQFFFVVPGGAPRLRDDTPSSQKQGGVALRYYAESIHTEFGLFYMRYHSKTPAVGFEANVYNPTPALPPDLIPGGLPAVPTGYFRQYAEGINLYGVSFATDVLNVAVAGELNYRPDDPVPIVANFIAMDRAARAWEAGGPLPARASGFVTESRLQAQVNMIWSVGPATRLLGPLVRLMRADDINVIGEVAVVDYDLDERKRLRRLNQQALEDLFPEERGEPIPIDEPIDYAEPSPEHRVTESSWGYQLLIQPTYTNPFGIPITVQPRLGFQHDVNGTTPGQLPFIEERKALTLGVDVDYLSTWGASLGYTSFFGGGTANLSQDRDFVSVSLSYAF